MTPRKRKTNDPDLPPGWGEVTLSPAAAAFGAAFEGLAQPDSEPAAGSITAEIMALDPRLSALEYAERIDAILARVVAMEDADHEWAELYNEENVKRQNAERALALAVEALTGVAATVRFEGTANDGGHYAYQRCGVCGYGATDVPITHGTFCLVPRLAAVLAKITEVSA